MSQHETFVAEYGLQISTIALHACQLPLISSTVTSVTPNFSTNYKPSSDAIAAIRTESRGHAKPAQWAPRSHLRLPSLLQFQASRLGFFDAISLTTDLFDDAD
jgi:hypothetical protein